MTKAQLVDEISSKLCRERGRLESRRSWLAIRNYLEDLDTDQLLELFKEYK